MTVRELVLGGLLAAGSALLAVLERESLPAALPLAAFAVAVAAIVLVLTASPSGAPSSPEPFRAIEITNVRAWLRERGMGREEIASLLDQIDRMGSRPNLSMRSEREMETLRKMDPKEFHSFVTRRLDEIEGPA